MTRLCERPGCSEPGAIAYGFDADRQLVWLSPLDPDGDRNRSGTLCLRHADSMVVPVGWTLEDARDPMPRLFKPAPRTRAPRATPRRSGHQRSRAAENDQQLALDEATVAAVTGLPSTADDPDATVAIPWMPEFDIDDELGGALSADTPLLARAFRGVDRRD